jgi:MinD-like ATPase involved in chromosome partitioning or flagellar assembly
MTRILSFHSFRRGAGKSLIVANLAALLAMEGRRVCVVDAAFHSPSLHVLFALGDDDGVRSLNDFIWGKCDIEQTAHDVTAALAGETPGRVFLVPANPRPAAVAQMLRDGYDVRLLDEGLRTLAEAFALDALLIDTHAGINEETLVAAALADGLVIVMRTDRQDHLGTGVTIEIARRLAVPQLFLMLNETPAGFDPAAVRTKVEQGLGCQVAAVLPHSDDLLTFAGGGLFASRFPDHLFTTTLRSSMTILFPQIAASR